MDKSDFFKSVRFIRFTDFFNTETGLLGRKNGYASIGYKMLCFSYRR